MQQHRKLHTIYPESLMNSNSYNHEIHVWLKYDVKNNLFVMKISLFFHKKTTRQK